MTRLEIPDNLLGSYDAAAPRYTSYPPIPYWHDLKEGQWKHWMDEAGSEDSSLSLYVHVPFCASRCFYCGCFVVITSQEEQGVQYAEAVIREMELVRERVTERGPVRQFHFGGGTPTYLAVKTLGDIVARARALFPFSDDVEMSIEVDPRTVARDGLASLRELGFNRLSMGVQDFDAEVQRAVNRIQPFGQVMDLMEAGRDLGYRSINVDLIYGLPKQTPESFAKTMEQVRRLAPSRIALYHYAHLPRSIPYQRRFTPEMLPSKEDKLEIFLAARENLMDWGYVPIGLDHFALEDDDLTTAYRQGTMQRNFMGYTTRAGEEMLSFGISAISDYKGHFWQNEKKLNRYHDAIAEGVVPVARGIRLSDDDLVRKAAIGALFCGGRLDFAEIESRFSVDPRRYFATELEAVRPMADDGLVVFDTEGIGVTEMGQMFLRNIAVNFDAYHGTNHEIAQKFSRTL